MNLGAAYSDELYARGLPRRLRRALELGWRYYVWDLPRYAWYRRGVGLKALDLQAITNPIVEFFDRKDKDGEPHVGFDDALSCLARAGVRLTLPPSRIGALARCWERTAPAPGDVIECGSYRGATGLLLALLGKLRGRPQKVLLLDTFRGSPGGCAFDSLRTTREYVLPEDHVGALRRQAEALGVNDRIEVHQGTFQESFERLATRDARFALAHIDANLYQSTLEACRFVIPRVAAGGAVVFDDYHGPCDLGARLAIDQFLAPAGQRPRRLAGSSAVLWK
ncbi:MAG TPA: class I SAM-dependent methyltransferase [Pirellulales bacterium]|nr:class I SAM-dependent methyltransferase [Pirellulales bacterium]